MALVLAALLAYLPLPLLGAQVTGPVRPRRLLLQVGSQSQRGQAGAHVASKLEDPRSASWFDAYTAEESNMDDPDQQPMLPVVEDSAKPVTKSEAFFRESASNGPKEALQKESRDLLQDKNSAQGPASGVKNAQWFDHSPDHSDAYGRPEASAVANDSLGLVQRSVSVNVTCAKPGCGASASLQIYNPMKEYVQDCKLNFGVHATDYDDNYAGERVLNILANGRALGGDCFPLVNGCVSQLSREQLYPCVREVPVDSIISSKGKLRVKASIPKVVDECPYRGNLLHGVTTVTCLVGHYTTTTTTTTSMVPPVYPLENDFVKKWLADHPDKDIEDMPGYKSLADAIEGVNGNGSKQSKQKAVAARIPAWPKFETRPLSLNASAFMRCAEKGCASGMLLDLNRTALRINKCLAQVYVNQTDFDNSDGAVELLNISVGGKPVLVNAKPGQNPCRDYYDGKPLSMAARRYHALKDYDVTEAVKKGPVGFHASISRQVDECASNGYLLDSMLQINCNISTIGALLEDQLTTVREVLSLNEIVYDQNNTAADDAMKEFFNLTEAREAAKSGSSKGVSGKVSGKSATQAKDKQ